MWRPQVDRGLLKGERSEKREPGKKRARRTSKQRYISTISQKQTDEGERDLETKETGSPSSLAQKGSGGLEMTPKKPVEKREYSVPNTGNGNNRQGTNSERLQHSQGATSLVSRVRD